MGGSRGEPELATSRARTSKLEPGDGVTEAAARLRTDRPTIKTARSKLPTSQLVPSRARPPTAPPVPVARTAQKTPSGGTYSVTTKARPKPGSQPLERESMRSDVTITTAGLAVQLGDHTVTLTRREARALVDKLLHALK